MTQPVNIPSGSGEKKRGKKRSAPKPIKVELGSKDKSARDFKHLDLRSEEGLQVVGLPFKTGSVLEFYSCFALENLDRHGVAKLLPEVFRCLKRDGKLELILHNLLWAAQALAKQPEWAGSIVTELYGKQDRVENFRYWAYTPESITVALKSAGFEKVEVVNPGVAHSTHVIATK